MGHKEFMPLFDRKEKAPIKIVGVMNPLMALLAKEAGFKALYLSGASLSSQWGKPDLGILTLNDIVEAARRITSVVDLPLIVDIDNGWNHPLLLERGGNELKQAEVLAVQIEDQAGVKRCGHLPVKELVSREEMSKKIAILKKCLIQVVARTDALGVEGLDKTITRVKAYESSGADALFLEGVTTPNQIEKVRHATQLPLLINLTEFGKTPLWTDKELHKLGVDLILYPMTINRVVYQAAKEALQQLLKEPSQQSLLNKMMTRDELYKLIHYQDEEDKLI